MTTVFMLLEKGADPSIKDRRGLTAFDVATPRCSSLLLSFTKSTTSPNNYAFLTSQNKALQERVTQLQTSLANLQELQKTREDEIKIQKECWFCCENPRATAVVPCGHLTFCHECVDAFVSVNREQHVCPTCREPIEEFINIFQP
jgi:Zinc finger, C3HC4 type (RING finger)